MIAGLDDERMKPDGDTTLVIGSLEIARRTCAVLRARGQRVIHLLQPTDTDIRAALSAGVTAVAVLVRGDVTALRYALFVEHLLPEVALVVTLFDRTVAGQLVRAVPNCRVTSPADIAVPSIIGACLGDVLAVDQDANGPFVLTRAPGGVTRTPWRPRHSRLGLLRNALASQARPHDTTSTILLAGLAGLLLVLGTDWLIAMTALHHSPGRALYAAARIVATVGPADADADAPAWYLAFATAAMLLTIGTTALFTAGVVNRLRSPRSVSLIGRRTLPTRDHVVVVGLGQVGLRLCTHLRRLRIPVVAVERNPRATNLRLARKANVPVLIAHADDRNILRTLSLHRARALAAMGADELDNVAVAITALSVAPDLRIVLRAGENEVIAETRSLFHIGEVRDVTALTTAAVTLSITGQPWQTVYASDHDLLAYPALDSASAAPVRCECDGTPVLK